MQGISPLRGPSERDSEKKIGRGTGVKVADVLTRFKGGYSRMQIVPPLVFCPAHWMPVSVETVMFARVTPIDVVLA